jgi:hypothetical protein
MIVETSLNVMFRCDLIGSKLAAWNTLLRWVLGNGSCHKGLTSFAEIYMRMVPINNNNVTPWPGLNRIDRILISTRYTFSGNLSEKNSRLSVCNIPTRVTRGYYRTLWEAWGWFIFLTLQTYCSSEQTTLSPHLTVVVVKHQQLARLTKP